MTHLRLATAVAALLTYQPAAPSTMAQQSIAASPPVMEAWGQTADGRRVDRVILRNAGGMEVAVSTLGATITAIRVRDRSGNLDDVVLGYDTIDGYLKRPSYLGVVIGRYANRIAGGSFTLEGTKYTLARNNGPNHLHGGGRGWDKAVWRGEPFHNASGVGVALSHGSPDGDEGYPGTVQAKVTYTLNDRDELVVDYEAATDKTTVINMTQHTFFNLAGSRGVDVLGHELKINADRYTPVDDTLIPTGEIAPVADTPFDFRTATPIGARIEQNHQQLQRGRGYDHNYVLTRDADGLSPAARVYEPITGRTLDVSTTEPGMQFYSGNFLDGSIIGKAGRAYGRRSGFCLETQHFPDSPNQPNFPTTVVRPGKDYRSTTVFRFGVQKQG